MSLRVPFAVALFGAALGLVPATTAAAAAPSSLPSSVALAKGKLASPRVVDVAAISGVTTAHRQVERQELTPVPSLADAVAIGTDLAVRPAARTTGIATLAGAAGPTVVSHFAGADVRTELHRYNIADQPPDPALAVSPDRVVQMVNSMATVSDRAGAELASFDLKT